jgi:hypothetical protein
MRSLLRNTDASRRQPDRGSHGNGCSRRERAAYPEQPRAPGRNLLSFRRADRPSRDAVRCKDLHVCENDFSFASKGHATESNSLQRFKNEFPNQQVFARRRATLCRCGSRVGRRNSLKLRGTFREFTCAARPQRTEVGKPERLRIQLGHSTETPLQNRG